MLKPPDLPDFEKVLIPPRRFRFGLAWLVPVLAFLPAIVTLVLIRLYAVNLPFWDDWERVPYIRMWEKGTLTFKALCAPHIDHRMFFPRLIMLGCNKLSGGDLRLEMAVNFVIVLLTAVGVVKLLQATIEPGSRLPWGLIFAGNLLLFSPMQYENWLWAVQTAFFLPMACLVWVLVVVLRPRRWWIRQAAALSLAIIGTHSFGHGFIVWPAVLGVVVLTQRFPGTARDPPWPSHRGRTALPRFEKTPSRFSGISRDVRMAAWHRHGADDSWLDLWQPDDGALPPVPPAGEGRSHVSPALQD